MGKMLTLALIGGSPVISIAFIIAVRGISLQLAHVYLQTFYMLFGSDCVLEVRTGSDCVLVVTAYW